MSKKIRLFINSSSIKPHKIVEINDNDFDYLIKVMRKRIGDELLVFNGIDGEFTAKITDINKKNCQIEILTQSKVQYFPPKITLAFAPIKNVRIDFLASKATELGITNFQPIITQNTIVDKINSERFNANIKEAIEQCERLDFPEYNEPVKLVSYLKKLNENQILILCDESGNGLQAKDILPKLKKDLPKEVIIFTGPEGGFSKSEFELFNQQFNLHKITLGPRILRADTAIISAITLVQEFIGDFDRLPNFVSDPSS